MLTSNQIFLISILIIGRDFTTAFSTRNFDCGPYGFICEGVNRIRLCEGDNLLGPAFNCPANTVCNEDSSDVCENTINYIDPAISRTCVENLL
ncbi:unnamed protein product, partial [Iphiclides podalirius]